MGCGFHEMQYVKKSGFRSPLGWALHCPGGAVPLARQATWASPRGSESTAFLGVHLGVQIPRRTDKTATGGLPVPSQVCPHNPSPEGPYILHSTKSLSSKRPVSEASSPQGFLCVPSVMHAHLSSVHFVLPFVMKLASLRLPC